MSLAMTIKKQKEININKAISIDPDYTVHNFPDGKLVFFFNRPNWVLLSNDEFDVFKLLEEIALRDVITKYSEGQTINTLRKLLSRRILNVDNVTIEHKTNQVLPMFMYITNKCNLRCKHCYMYSGEPLKYELDFDEWKDIIEGFIQYGGKELIICGGEPLTVHFFTTLTEWTKKRSSGLRIRLFTNGTYLNNLSQDFLNKNISEVQLSIDGPVAEIHDRVRGKGHFNKIMDNIIRLRDYRGGVTIDSVTCFLQNQKRV